MLDLDIEHLVLHLLGRLICKAKDSRTLVTFAFPFLVYRFFFSAEDIGGDGLMLKNQSYHTAESLRIIHDHHYIAEGRASMRQ